MKILSSDSKQWIEVKRFVDDDYSSYELGVSIDVGHGHFTGRNKDIQFLNLKEFIENLDSFILSRELKPRLEGTYDSFVEFYSPKNKNSIMVNFCVGDAYAGYPETAMYGLKGSFEFNVEYLNDVLEKFKAFEENA